jgi:uncharacterized protein YjiS (DUF1127 family)
LIKRNDASLDFHLLEECKNRKETAMSASPFRAPTFFGRLLAPASRPQSALGRLRLWNRLHRQRRSLAELDDAMLRDIGVTRAEALAEARRSPWDVPPSWLR